MENNFTHRKVIDKIKSTVEQFITILKHFFLQILQLQIFNTVVENLILVSHNFTRNILLHILPSQLLNLKEGVLQGLAVKYLLYIFIKFLPLINCYICLFEALLPGCEQFHLFQMGYQHIDIGFEEPVFMSCFFFLRDRFCDKCIIMFFIVLAYIHFSLFSDDIFDGDTSDVPYIIFEVYIALFFV